MHGNVYMSRNECLDEWDECIGLVRRGRERRGTTTRTPYHAEYGMQNEIKTGKIAIH